LMADGSTTVKTRHAEQRLLNDAAIAPGDRFLRATRFQFSRLSPRCRKSTWKQGIRAPALNRWPLDAPKSGMPLDSVVEVAKKNVPITVTEREICSHAIQGPISFGNYASPGHPEKKKKTGIEANNH